jgi:SpoVK/Ycf46/Vps4 family AAA+-type ATPase
MENLNINNILDRTEISNQIKNILSNFETTKHDLSIKKGIYLYGNPGVGKTAFITGILKDMNFDIIKYDAGDVRNKTIIDTITKHNMADTNVLSLLHRKKKHIAIIMDEIDGMNNGDKGGINALIKLIRPKKTKKQKLEDVSLNPIICIGNYHVDKKIKELMKVCHTFELKTPSKQQIIRLLDILTPSLDTELKQNMLNYISGDLKKLVSIYNIYKQQNSLMRNEIIQNIFQPKTNNDDSKKITFNLINNHVSLNNHNHIMNETDRTIVGLLWHENIVDIMKKIPHTKAIPLYTKFLDNICFADYVDRITFQKQIWQFNEMSSLVKTIYNNNILHKSLEDKPKLKNPDVRFTKVLTKYSTEYNNSVFIQSLCDKLQMDKKDLLLYFQELRKEYSIEQLLASFENIEISKLDINRLYRYIDKVNNYSFNEDDKSVVEI